MKYMRMRSVAMLLGGVCAAALAVPSYAAEVDSNGLGEIVVTAQRRSENLQQTPIAISAISSKAIELQGISEVRDISALAPNLSILPGTTNATAVVITLRGIPTAADETQGFDSPVGVYLDGVYLARSSAASFEVADIERVEVLRGPQGTLFGRNTTGGAINFITKLPSDDASLKVKLGYGNYNQVTGRAVFNTGLIGDSLRASFAYIHKRRDGVVDNLLQPKKSLDPGGNNIDGARFAVTYQPTDNITITDIADYTAIDGVPAANQLAAVGDGVLRPVQTINGATLSQVQPANVGGYLANATALESQCGSPLSNVGRARRDSICLENAGNSTDQLWGNLLRIEVDFGPVKLRSSTSLRGWKNNIRGSDLDGLGTTRGPAFTAASALNGIPAGILAFNPNLSPGAIAFISSQSVPTTTQPLFQAKNRRAQTQVSEELELISDNDGAFNWVLGGFYFSENGSETNEQSFGFILDTVSTLGAFFGSNVPAGTRFRSFATPSSTLAYSASARSLALYGQASYRPAGVDGPLGVTLGLRYTWDRKNFSRSQNGATPFTSIVDLGLNTSQAEFGKLTGHFTVDYRAADDINLYARVARGYRSGGFNARQTTNSNPANGPNLALIPFGEETIWSYEAGVKTEFFDRLRLNASVFYNQYSDLQVTVPIPGGATFGTQVVNAGRTDYSGAELEGRFAVTDNFSVDGSLGYVHKNVKNFPAVSTMGANVNIASVITPGISPDYTANLAANMTYPIGEMNLTGRVGWSFVSSQVFFANPLTAPFNNAIRSDAHGLFDAQLRIDNIKFGPSAPPVGLTFWGKNIGNKDYVARGIDFGQLGFGSVIYGDPATFGATLDIEF